MLEGKDPETLELVYIFVMQRWRMLEGKDPETLELVYIFVMQMAYVRGEGP